MDLQFQMLRTWSYSTCVGVARGPGRDLWAVFCPMWVARVHYASNFKLLDPRVAFILDKLDMNNFRAAMICHGYWGMGWVPE